MVVSILMRKTRIRDSAQYDALVAELLPKATEIMKAQPGFVSVQYLWSLTAEGEIAQITTWTTSDDCRRYVREGAAATVATIEDAVIPTAAHPDGAWVRKTYETAGR